MKFVAMVFKKGIQDNTTTPPTLDQLYKLRIVQANNYHEALERIAKEELWETETTGTMNRLDYQRAISKLMTEYNVHLLLHTSFEITFKAFLLKLKWLVIKKDARIY